MVRLPLIIRRASEIHCLLQAVHVYDRDNGRASWYVDNAKAVRLLERLTDLQEAVEEVRMDTAVFVSSRELEFLLTALAYLLGKPYGNKYTINGLKQRGILLRNEF